MQYHRFLNDPSVKEEYTDIVKSENNEQNMLRNSKWDSLREALVISAIKVIPKITRQEKEERMA